MTFKISSRNQNQVFYMILYVYDKKDHSSSGSLKCSLLVGEGNSQVQMLSQFSFSTRRSASYQQQFNVKMFAGSQTKLWGDGVSTDGTLFCSVETALAHAGFSCHRLQTAAAMEKVCSTNLNLYLHREGWLSAQDTLSFPDALSADESNNVTKRGTNRIANRREA